MSLITTIETLMDFFGSTDFDPNRQASTEFSVTVPRNALLPHEATNLQIGFMPLSLKFWIQSFVFLMLQSVFNVMVALIVYHWIVQERSETKRWLVGYGLLCPLLVMWPIFLFSQLLEFRNLALMLCLAGAIPNLLLLRVTEAIHGLLPDFCYQTLQQQKQQDAKNKPSPKTMLLLYYSATLQFQFDPRTLQPVPLTASLFRKKAMGFLSSFVQTALLYSLLLPLDFELLSTTSVGSTTRHNSTWISMGLFHPYQIVNNFLVASLLSLVLEGGASGLGLLFSLATGLAMEDFSHAPLTQSSSPSDFWGRRWDRPIASALRRGAFRPMKQLGMSRHTAALITFVLSGIIHEYVLYVTSLHRGNDYNYLTSPTKGRQALFFIWNGSLILLERLVLQLRTTYKPLDKVLTNVMSLLPRPIQTAMVLMLVLPIGHWFTDEYIANSFFADCAHGFPLISVTTQ